MTLRPMTKPAIAQRLGVAPEKPANMSICPPWRGGTRMTVATAVKTVCGVGVTRHLPAEADAAAGLRAVVEQAHAAEVLVPGDLV